MSGALSLGAAVLSADAETAGSLRAAQIAAIVRLTPVAIGASCLNALVLLATFWAVGELKWQYWLWAGLIFALAAYYFGNWAQSRRREPIRTASPRAIRRTVRNGCVFGAVWGVIPAVAFPGASPPVQLFIAVLTSGMMCAGGFVLATVSPAAISYIAIVAAASIYALLQQTSPIHLGLVALTLAYTMVLMVSANRSAALFISSRLAEAQLRKETEARETAQVQAAHAERMSALGELAGGIAHDFNNILQAVSAGAQLAARHAEEPDSVRRYADQIATAVERGAAISGRLLGFARQDRLRPEQIQPGELLGNVGELLAHTMDPSIHVTIEVPAETPGLAADRYRLETVLLNLANNARDAMPGGGTLSISAAVEDLAHDIDAPALKRGRYVRITVRDTGSGMDAVTLARAGQPFFTTKPKGKGTGLGLSMARGFAEQSGGALAITSEPSRGTTVTLWFPQAEGARAQAPEERALAPVRAGLRVMLVDDDDQVRATLAGSLEDAGFVVTSAESAEQALDELRRGVQIDALVTDLSMPGMNGWDLIREIQAQRPLLPSLMLTGHLQDADADSLASAQNGRFAVLRKPVAPLVLARRIAALVDKAP
ncbi:MAG TPA: ATP-binding protein [Caulobacteraceae bacterium]|nr:ATP-binding protein [Caulobacteraceae bacterium]